MVGNGQTGANARAAAWLGSSVFAYSWYPLVIALVGASVGPVVFMFWFVLTVAAVYCLYLLLFHPDLARRNDAWLFAFRQLRNHGGRRDVLLASLQPLNLVLFVWATRFDDTALVTIISAGATILFVVFRQRHDTQRPEPRYERVPAGDWWLLGIAVLGIALVTLSQTGGLLIERSWWRLPVGLVLAVGSTLCAAFEAHRFRVGERLHSITIAPAHSTHDPRAQAACILVVSIVAYTPGAIAGLLTSLLSSSATLFPSGLFAVVIVGAVSALGDIAFRYANLETSNLAVNALHYARPLLSLGWLWAFATVDVVRADWLVIGAAAVVAANALIMARSNDRYGLTPAQ